MERLTDWKEVEAAQQAHPDVQKALCEAIRNAEDTKAYGVACVVMHEGGFSFNLGGAEEHRESLLALGNILLTLLQGAVRAVEEGECHEDDQG